MVEEPRPAFLRVQGSLGAAFGALGAGLARRPWVALLPIAVGLALSFGLAIACYHFIEIPMRYAGPEAIRDAKDAMRHGLFKPEFSTKVAAVAALGLVALALISYAMRPERYEAAAHQVPAAVVQAR